MVAATPVAASADAVSQDQAGAAREPAAGSTDKVARGDKADRKERRKKRRARDWKGIVSITVSPDGRFFGVAGADGNIRLLDARLRERFRSRGHGGLPAAGVAFSPNGKRVISVGRDTGVSAWDNANGKRERRSFGHEHPIRTVAVSADGKFIASGGEETRIFLWDAATGKLARILNGHADFVNCLAFSPDGQVLASGDADSRIHLWDVATGQQIKTLLGHWDEVNAVAFSPDGGRLASGSVDSRVLLWDVASGSQLRSLNGHQGAVRTVAFSRDGASLFSAGEDSRILGWNGVTGELQTQIGSLTSAGNSLVVTPEGMVVIGGDDDKISEWDPKRRSKRQTATFVPEPRADSSNVQPFARVPPGAAVKASDAGAASPIASAPAASSFWGGVIGTVLDWLIPPVHAAIPPAPGGPILIVKSASSLFSDYYAEILRAEGLNEFAVLDIGDVTDAVLAQYDLVILAKMTLTSDQVNLFSNWVNGDASHPGGNLIAIAPDPQLSGLLGVSGPGSTLSNGYLLVNTATSPGNGIVNQTIQFHGTADRYTLAGASSIATLYLDAATATENPAVTLHAAGSHGGQAAAFTYDLATSIVQTRQGNPAWRDMERDGFPPQRSDDKFFGDAAFDSQADWINLDKVAIPQADEQQRLLANLILHMNLPKKPLPRFWYFPRDHKAVVIMTGDDHGNNGTQGRFNQFIAASPSACSSSDPEVRAQALQNWQCVRGTSYIFPSSPLSAAQATAFEAQGFEIGLHINTGCADFTLGSLRTFYSDQLASFATKWPGVPAPITQRHHCIAWTDWATGAIVQLENGIRFDTSYYFWPPGWVQDRPGFFSGSGMPMRFADLDGSVIDVFHATSQMTDESGQSYPFTINTL
ncbi:MAG: WD40 repeat domain-containing protein, partial [Gammaproteobacteria bacterium]|nr:WD40 repeat domain-containing protein [Gammaproteobacteria bacterium]